MSYDLTLTDPVTRTPLYADTPHQIAGGTYCQGGTAELWVNVTWNYSDHLNRVLSYNDETGVKALNGITGSESIPLLKDAISKLGDDTTENYWDGTEGNAKRALYSVLALAQLRPDGIWEVC